MKRKKNIRNLAIAMGTYTYDPKKRIIIIKYKGGIEEVLNDVKLGFSDNYKQTLFFTLFNNRLKQEVTYYLTSI